MGRKERRKNPRIQIYDPISFLSVDSDGKMLQHNVAVVRNVGKTGIRIEAFQPINATHIALMFFDLDQNQIEVSGEVIYCERNDCGHYNVGINLASSASENRQFVKALVKSYHYHKNKTHLSIAPGILN